MKFALTVFVSIFLLLVNPLETLAVNINISNYPASISTDQFSVDVSIEGADAGTNYLRVDLYKDGSTNYFGETYNGGNWYSGSDGSQYFPVQISASATASATLQAKFGNPTSAEYPGPGDYKLKIRRYTSSGNPASSDFQTPINMSITVPTPTSTPTPTASPTPSPTPTPTATPSPTPKPTAKPTPTSRATIEPLMQQDSSEEILASPQVLGENYDFAQASPSPDTNYSGGSNKAAILLMAGGIGFIGVALLPFLKRVLKRYEQSS